MSNVTAKETIERLSKYSELIGAKRQQMIEAGNKHDYSTAIKIQNEIKVFELEVSKVQSELLGAGYGQLQYATATNVSVAVGGSEVQHKVQSFTMVDSSDHYSDEEVPCTSTTTKADGDGKGSISKLFPPKKPYTEYTIFFRLEQSRIVQSTGSVNDEVLASYDPNHYDPLEFPRPSKYQNIIMYPYWYSSSHKAAIEKKRKHKKLEGRMDFNTLSKKISVAWRHADYEVVQYCRKLAKAENEKYNMIVEKINRQEKLLNKVQPQAEAKSTTSTQDEILIQRMFQMQQHTNDALSKMRQFYQLQSPIPTYSSDTAALGSTFSVAGNHGNKRKIVPIPRSECYIRMPNYSDDSDSDEELGTYIYSISRTAQLLREEEEEDNEKMSSNNDNEYDIRARRSKRKSPHEIENNIPVSSEPKERSTKKKRKKYTCCNEGCTNKVVKGGVCWNHGAKLTAAKVKICSNEGYANQVRSGGVCRMHGAEGKVKTCSHEACTKPRLLNVRGENVEGGLHDGLIDADDANTPHTTLSHDHDVLLGRGVECAALFPWVQQHYYGGQLATTHQGVNMAMNYTCFAFPTQFGSGTIGTDYAYGSPVSLHVQQRAVPSTTTQAINTMSMDPVSKNSAATATIPNKNVSELSAYVPMRLFPIKISNQRSPLSLHAL